MNCTHTTCHPHGEAASHLHSGLLSANKPLYMRTVVHTLLVSASTVEL
jgi:hypothetical protein